MGGMDRIKARELRKNLTEAEQTLWKHLRLRQFGGWDNQALKETEAVKEVIMGALGCKS